MPTAFCWNISLSQFDKRVRLSLYSKVTISFQKSHRLIGWLFVCFNKTILSLGNVVKYYYMVAASVSDVDHWWMQVLGVDVTGPWRFPLFKGQV